MITTIWRMSSSWSLTALPLFIWMGEILFRTRLSEDMFKGLAPWMANLPGRLLHTNIVGCTVFAAVSGSSAATVTTVGKMSIPELRRRGYPEMLIVGTLAGAGTLGLMIPPSLTLIVYGVTIQESISKLFMAGILPGLTLATLFMGYIAIWSFVRKDQVPAPDRRLTFAERVAESRFLIPVICLIFLVLGSIYLGFATATEAAAFGVIGALSLAAIQGSLTWGKLYREPDGRHPHLLHDRHDPCRRRLPGAGHGLHRPAKGARRLDRFLELSPIALIAALTLFYIVLGCFLDGISSVVLTMAVVDPMVRGAGIDMIWFGIFIVVVVEMAQITPPIGFNLFVLQGMTGHEISYIARTALPFFLLMCLMVIILVMFPEIATFLPETMRQAPG